MMHFSAAKDAINAFLAETSDIPIMRRVDFMGGEPLTAYPLIHDVCEWAWSDKHCDDIVFFVTTNGSLLTPEMKQWFSSNRDRITLALSYDGEHAQKLNRNERLPDINFFKETWPNQPFKMTMTEDSISFLSSDIEALYKSDIRFVSTFSMGMPNWRKESIAEFEQQMRLLTDFYCGNAEADMLRDFNLQLSAVFSKQLGLHCGIGNSFYVVDSESRRFPCQILSSLTLSDIELEEITIESFWSRPNHSVKACEDCVLDPLCPICYAMSYKKSHQAFSREPSICELFRIQVMTACKYFIRLAGKKTNLTTDDRAMAEAVAYILSRL